MHEFISLSQNEYKISDMAGEISVRSQRGVPGISPSVGQNVMEMYSLTN